MKKELLEKYKDRVVAIRDGILIEIYDGEEAFKDIVEKYDFISVLYKED